MAQLSAEEEKALKITTPEFVTSYPFVFKGRENDDGKTKFSIAAVFTTETLGSPKGKAFLAAAEKAIKLAAKKKWGDSVPKNLNTPFHTDEEEIKDKGYASLGAGMYFNASSDQPPGIVDGQLNKITDESKVYPGVIARATIKAFAYEKKGKKGVSFGLNNIQILRDGKRLDSRKAADEDFDALEPADLEGALQGLK